MSRPDPVSLAGRLFQLEMTLPFGICSFDPLAYREVLGEQGLHRYRELALAKWRTVEPRNAGDAYEAGRMSITRIMECLAEDSGDIEQLLENYKKLALVAGKMGQWHAQREGALSVVDTAIVTGAFGHRQSGRQPAELDYSLRVAVALWEQDIGAAWQYANVGVCDRNLLMVLADELEMERLDDAIELYRRVVPALLEQTNNAAYEEAIGIVQKMADALGAHQRAQELAAYLGFLRAEFKRKRNFIKLLDRFSGSPAT